MKNLFVAAGPYTWGSSRMRCYWPARHMQNTGVTEFRNLNRKENAGSMIWQKNVDLDYVRAYPNRRHYWDVCDPSWWWGPDDARQIADVVTKVIASSLVLRDDFNQWYGREKAICIPDRLDLEHFPMRREHVEVSPVRFIWYGIAVNRIAIFGQLANLERLVANKHLIELTIYDDRPDQPMPITDMFPVYHSHWNIEQENQVIASHDVALLPTYPGPWGRVKSNNKQLTAWACGLPAVSNLEYSGIELLMQSENRQAAADINLSDWRVEKSAQEWEALLCAS